MEDISLDKTALVYHPEYVKHNLGFDHPERPERISKVVEHLKDASLLSNPKLSVLYPDSLTDEDLMLVHTDDYIEKVRNMSNHGGMLSIDTPIQNNTYDIAKLSAGGAVLAGKIILEGKACNSFGLIRPPGHHAGRNYGGGFCYFNNIAILVEYLRKHFGLKRFMIMDWDVHHGNGTQDIFYEDPTVLYFSTHQMPLYPGTGYIEEIGKGEGKGYTVNLPLQAGTSGKTYEKILDELFFPLAKEFRPEMILVSAGQDAHTSDPIANLQFTNQNYIKMTKRIMEIAESVCERRLTMVLEGGYNLTALSETISGIIMTMAGINQFNILESTPKEVEVDKEVESRIEQLKIILKNYWKTFQ
ncbi:histone deacetylase family protein [[Eubacterium] cellulosolvens]